MLASRSLAEGLCLGGSQAKGHRHETDDTARYHLVKALTRSYWDTPALTDLAASGGQAIKPTWLPDGSGVIFCDSIGNMRTILADGSGLAPAVTGDPVKGLHPRVRPTP